ncbi:MAG: thioredoxin family protein [Muribaculaceae bacterium]|nr:thioredoxin family protein [Muribaculaceae bacterium]
MKKYILIAALAAMSLASCSKSESKSEADKATATETQAVADDNTADDNTADAVQPMWSAQKYGEVESLADDNVLRPDTKVSGLTIVDFNATWCVPCKQFAPVFDESAKKYEGVHFVSADIDKLPATAQAFQIEAVPTVVFIKPDGTTLRFVGTEDLLPADKFEKLVNENF